MKITIGDLDLEEDGNGGFVMTQGDQRIEVPKEEAERFKRKLDRWLARPGAERGPLFMHVLREDQIDDE